MSATALPVLSTSSGLAAYLEEIKKFPVLTLDEEVTLSRRWIDLGDLSAAHQLVTSHLRLVAKIAFKFRGYGLPLVDLISEGNIGLMQAVKKFNPDVKCRLSTYAMWWIKANIQDYILKSWSMVKTSSSATQKKLFFNLKKIKNKLMHMHQGNVPADQDALIAKELGVKESEVRDMDARFSSAEMSLDDPVRGDETSQRMDLFIDPTQDSHEIEIIDKHDHNARSVQLSAAISKLNDREKDIILSRKLKDTPDTLDKLSERHGVSRERIRQIEQRAFEKLQLDMNPPKQITCSTQVNA